MIIREVTKEDIPVWLSLGHDKDAIINELVDNPTGFWQGFTGWAERKIQRHEAFIAADRITNKCLGIIAFSVKHNRVSFVAADRDNDFDKIGSKLLGIVLNQLDWNKEITANVLNSTLPIIKQEKALYAKYGFKEHLRTTLEAGVPALQMLKPAKGEKSASSFHFNYPQYIDWMQEEKCPICNYETKWENYDLVVKLEYSTVYASMRAQGGLWGNCMIVSKKHVIEFSDFSPEELSNFISDMQKTVVALKVVSRAVRINMEQHGNTIPHLHIHLFPRYIDDLNAGRPIDYNNRETSAYESKMEYDYFIHQMKKKLSIKTHKPPIKVKHNSDIQLDSPSPKENEV
jgi:diadenosine tetraphosphate (Ap4A) HIT family hydrolase